MSERTGTFRRTDRTDAPLYLARYSQRRSREEAGTDGVVEDDATPLGEVRILST